jgi:F420-non-reducing hydrogenase iron-sulfur subunit
MSEDRPQVLVFLCQWCLQAEADWVARTQFPTNVRVVEVPCSGRLNPFFILSALQRGADGVLVVGCEPGDCHFKEGNYLARRKLTTLKGLLDYIGLEEQRVQFAWIGDAERGKFQQLVDGLVEDVSALGPAGKNWWPSGLFRVWADNRRDSVQEVYRA